MVPFGHAMDGWKSKLSRLRVLNNEFHPTLTIFWWADVAKCWSWLLHASFSLVINSILSVCDCALPNMVRLLLQHGGVSYHNSVNMSSLHRKRCISPVFITFITSTKCSVSCQVFIKIDLPLICNVACFVFLFFLALEYDILSWFVISKSDYVTISLSLLSMEKSFVFLSSIYNFIIQLRNADDKI